MKRNRIFSIFLFVSAIVSSCTGMEDYLNIVGKEEITYPGKIEDVVVYSGYNRVLIEGLCISDAKVVDCEIKWNLDKESKVVPVDMSNGVFELSVEIELPESIYNFDLYTRDALGNRSIPVNVSAQVYGDSYLQQIRNRLMNYVVFTGTTATVAWYPIDTTLGPIYTELTYTTLDGESVTLQLPVAESESVLQNIDATQPVVYSTSYQPEEDCLDVFMTEYDEFYVQ